MIVRFLAVLELFKQGLVELDQAERVRRHRRSQWTGGDADRQRWRCAIDVYEG